jgi:hypothetical protein
MQLEENALGPGPASPSLRLPRKIRIDHFARPMHIFRLEARRGIRHLDVFVNAEAIAQTGARAGGGKLEPSIVRASHLMSLPLVDEFDPSRSRGPEAEGDIVRSDQRAERRTLDHGVPANYRIIRRNDR